MNDAGEVAGTIIGLVWLAIGWWMIAVGRRRGCADGGWGHVVGQIVVKDGAAEGVVPVRHLETVATQPAGGEVLVRRAELVAGAAWDAFAARPGIGDALLVALDDAAPGCVVALRFDCQVQGVGVNPEHPPLRWQAWTGSDWTTCDTERDGTGEEIAWTAPKAGELNAGLRSPAAAAKGTA